MTDQPGYSVKGRSVVFLSGAMPAKATSDSFILKYSLTCVAAAAAETGELLVALKVPIHSTNFSFNFLL